MKQFGYAVLVLGIVLILSSLSMDTTVPTGALTRVNNVGLMQSKQNYLIVSSLVFLAGLILVVVGYKSNAAENQVGKGKRFLIVLSWVVVGIVSVGFLYTLSPMYANKKYASEKHIIDYHENMKSINEMKRLFQQRY